MIDSGRHFVPMRCWSASGRHGSRQAERLPLALVGKSGLSRGKPKYPKLHELGSDGLYYTQEEIRGLIAYAATAAFALCGIRYARPQHGLVLWAPGTGQRFWPYKSSANGAFSDPAMDPTNGITYKFLTNSSRKWRKSFRTHSSYRRRRVEWERVGRPIRAFRRQEGSRLKDNNALQAYFSQRVQELVVKHGKTPSAGDEILGARWPKSIVIQSWRGADSLAAAANKVIAGFFQTAITWIWAGAPHGTMPLIPWGRCGKPHAGGAEVGAGGEACMWSEYVDPENIDSRIWPRTARLRKTLVARGCPRSRFDVRRLPLISQRLEWVGLNHRAYQRE